MRIEDTKIAIIDDEKTICEVLSAALVDESYNVKTAHDALHGLKLISEFRPQVVLLDIWMPGDMDGLDVLKKAKQEFPNIEFIIMSGHGTIEIAVSATKLGAWDFLEKPISLDKTFILINNILHFQSERAEKIALLKKLRKNVALIGDSSALVGIKQMISRVATTESWLLITGESGVGKELVAQNIHYLSQRASRPFVSFSVASISEELIEAELFGYTKKAFAGSTKSKRGIFEQSGVLFINDICDLSLQIQEKILKVLQEQSIKPVGSDESDEPTAVDCRLIAATKKDIKKEVEEKRFLPELYSRLISAPLDVPPLKDRKEDVPPLVLHFSDFIAARGGHLHKQFSASSMDILKNYSWPGNVRELRNFVERVYILSPESDYIDMDDLNHAGLSLGDHHLAINTFREARAQFEKEFLLKKISENNGSISKTANAIGLERSYLYRKIKTYGIEQ